jgi:hypothetical protein
MPSKVIASALHDEGNTMVITKRNYRAAWRPLEPLEPKNDSNYELTAVCLWSVVTVIMGTLLTWLALGGEL